MILRLMPISGFEVLESDARRILALQVGPRSEVQKTLSEWARSSRDESRKILKGLRMIAEAETLPPGGSSVKPVGSKGILEVKSTGGGNARLFCFEDTSGDHPVICVATFWVGHGEKSAGQNQAIREAEALMTRWREAGPLSGVPDARLESSR